MRLEIFQTQTKTCYKHVMSEANILKRSAQLGLLVLVAATMGCSVTSLQCGVDGDTSFVNLNTAPKILSQNARNMAELCSFAYNQEQS